MHFVGPQSLIQGSIVLQGSGQGRLLSGSYCPTLDKPEQGLELIREAARNAGCELNQGMGVIVDVGADTLYNEVHEYAVGIYIDCGVLIIGTAFSQQHYYYACLGMH